MRTRKLPTSDLSVLTRAQIVYIAEKKERTGKRGDDDAAHLYNLFEKETQFVTVTTLES